MTDKEKVEALFKELGIGYELDYPMGCNGELRIVCKALSCKNVEGYDGFVAIFNFDRDGKFDRLGVWE